MFSVWPFLRLLASPSFGLVHDPGMNKILLRLPVQRPRNSFGSWGSSPFLGGTWSPRSWTIELHWRTCPLDMQLVSSLQGVLPVLVRRGVRRHVDGHRRHVLLPAASEDNLSLRELLPPLILLLPGFESGLHRGVYLPGYNTPIH